MFESPQPTAQPETKLSLSRTPKSRNSPLRQLAEQRGWQVVKVYSDRMSGAEADRPELKALMQDTRRGAFDVVLVWRFDRFARSIEQLVLALAVYPGGPCGFSATARVSEAAWSQ